jgi:hypothetical protein
MKKKIATIYWDENKEEGVLKLENLLKIHPVESADAIQHFLSHLVRQ